jgi:FMN phosphatase YigB (HAD superfamily)
VDIIRSLEEFVAVATALPDAEGVFLDWHGVLCDDQKMREMYRQAPARLFPSLAEGGVNWASVEEQAYQDWVERFRRLSHLELAYPRVLAEADIAYYGALFRGKGFFLEGPRASDKWACRVWERQVTMGTDVSDAARRDAVQRLRRHGLRVYVASSGSQAHLSGTILASRFDTLIHGYFSAEAVGFFKSAPSFWSAVFQHAGIAPEHAVVLDDQPKMLTAPENLGARTFLFQPSLPGTAQ